MNPCIWIQAENLKQRVHSRKQPEQTYHTRQEIVRFGGYIVRSGITESKSCSVMKPPV